MKEEVHIHRRTALALLGAAGIGTGSVGYYVFAGDNPSQSGPDSEAQQGTNTPVQMGGVDIRDFGAAVDGRSNDASAFVKAVEQAAPKGTVLLPPGTLMVDSEDRNGAVQLSGEYEDLLIIGTGSSPQETEVVIKSGQEQRHVAFGLDINAGDRDGRITFANLTINGNAANQRSAGGFGIFAEGSRGTLALRDCVIRDTVNAGIRFSGGIAADIKHCAFIDCGNPDVSAGHALNPNQDEEVTVTVERCLFQNSAGADIDVGTDTEADYQRVNIDSCFFEMGLSGVKLDPGNALTRITNTRMVGGERTGRAIKANNDKFNCGSLELENVVIENIGGPAVDIGSQDFDDLQLKDVLFRNIENEGLRNSGDNNTAAGLYAERANFRSSGAISIHDVGPANGGDAVWFRRNCAGTVAELIHSGTKRVGKTDGVIINTVSNTDEPREPDVVTKDEVGPRSSPPVPDR